MNTELLRKIADQIERHPETYDQTKWVCGTSACIAGHAALLTGWKPATVEEMDACPEACLSGQLFITKGGTVAATHDVARAALGLEYEDADTLFGGDWAPPVGVSVPEQLRRYADGEPIRKDPNQWK